MAVDGCSGGLPPAAGRRETPALRLLVDHFPWRQVIGHHAPQRARSHQPPQAIQDFAQTVHTLRRLLGHEGQIGGDKGPFIITDIAGVGFSGRPPSVSQAGESTYRALEGQSCQEGGAAYRPLQAWRKGKSRAELIPRYAMIPLATRNAIRTGGSMISCPMRLHA